MVGWASWICCIDDQGIIFCICIYVDTLDDPEIPLWPIDEFGMESIDPTFIVEYGGNGGSELVVQ